MDVISYGVANKASKKEKDTRNNVLGPGVEGTFPHAKGRIDNLEKALQGVVSQADKLIVNDAVNIMKAHAKFNTVASSMKYKMHNMIFDDLLDLSGIDTAKSSGYSHDPTLGLINSGTIETTTEVTDTIPTKAILTVEEQLPLGYVNITPVMSSNVLPAPYEATASSYSDNAYMIFDANKDSRWASEYQYTSSWIQLDFGSDEKTIKKYSVQSWISNAHMYPPAEWKLKASDTGAFTGEEVELDYQNNQSWTNSEVKEFVINNEQSFRYYRFYTLRTVTSGKDVQIADIKYYESTSNSEESPYFISRDAGVTWETITPNTLFYFHDTISPQDNKIRIKAELPTGTKLLNYGLTWS